MLHLLFFLILLFFNSVFAATPSQPPATPSPPEPSKMCTSKPLSPLATVLGWTPTAITPANLCGGYYFEPADITAHPNPLPLTAMPMDISTTGPVTYNINNNSTLEGDVTLIQPGRKIRADKATLIPNKTSGQVETIDLEGNVQYQEAGRLIVGEMSQINLAKDTLVLYKGAYHVVRPSALGPMDSWGTADETHRTSPTFFWFQKATYTTCRPTDAAWHLKSNHVTLNKETGRGTATHVVLYAKNVPFFYSPYLSFPIDKRRKSGFLYPDFGYDNRSGAFMSLPYYLNLAPNYDDTFTLTPMGKRGIMGTNLFRYLTEKNTGSMQISFLPQDSAFASFKQQIKQQYPPSFFNTPFLDELNRSSNNRGYMTLHDDSFFNEHWTGSLDINYVTDDYYFQDFSSTFSAISTDQLLNQAWLAYAGEHWQFSGRAQAWQTLHPINQVFILDQYQRLPDLNLSSYWADIHGLNLGFNSEWVYFDRVNDFFTHLPYPTGSRLHFNPQMSLPLTNGGVFFTPSLGLDTTTYSVNNNGIIDTSVAPATIIPNSNPNLNKTRALPVFNIDTGLYAGRNLQIGKHDFYQTLEPRAFYLFVPATNQNNIPIFDTTLPPFSFDELYRTNRFMGYDRMGDANQLSLGLTSRLLDGFTGTERVNASVGAIYYFRKHTICLYPDCHDDPTISDKISPIAGQLTYIINTRMSLTGDIAWDPNNSKLNNSALSLNYNAGSKRIVNITYNFINNGDILNPADINSNRNNLQRINLAFSWPLTTHWNIVANWNYNISHAHQQTSFYGLEYETCCWAARFVSSRVLQSEDIAGNTTYRSAFYVQFTLKGLGSVGNSGGSNLLAASMPGYRDIFTAR